MKWEELREEEFEGAIEKSGGLCVIPIGCTEVHGEHLPVGTDCYEAAGVAEEAAKIEDVVIFPVTFWLGDVGSSRTRVGKKLNGMRGFIGVREETRMAVLAELCDEIARNGFRKILLLNCHGGNVAFLNAFMRKMREDPRDYALMMSGAMIPSEVEPEVLYEKVKADPAKFSMITDEDMKVLERFAKTGAGGGHADFKEAALMMHIRPDLVRIDRCTQTSGLSTHRSDYLAAARINSAFGWGANFPNSYNGFDPTGVTKNIGDALGLLCVERVAGVYKLLKEDERCVELAKMSAEE